MTPVEKMVATVSDEQLLADVLRTMEPKLRRRFLEIVRWLRDRKSTKEIVELIHAGRALEAVERADLVRAGNALAESVHAVYLAAGRELAALLSEKLDTFVPFDASNHRALSALQRVSHRIVHAFTVEQEDVIKRVVADGVARGLNPRTYAREIRAAIGLTPKQLDAVQNYRRLLETGSADALERKLRDRRFDRTVRRAIDEGRALTAAEVDRMVTRYRQRYLKYRSEVIARDEGIGAVHAGADEGWQQAIESGDVDAETLEQSWVATRDPRTRDSHRPMNGQKRDWGVPFTTGDGVSIRFPHDPAAPLSETAQCRCARVVRMKAVERVLPLAA